MSCERFTINEVNPNESVGGGGCLCSETKVPEAEGPYVVFHGAETASNISPHAVVCAGCIRAAARKIEGEALAAGEVIRLIPGEVPVAETTSDPRVGDDDVPEV